MYSIKKKFRKAISVGFNPQLWVIELCSYIINNAHSKSNETCTRTTNPYLNHFLLSAKPSKLEKFTVTAEIMSSNPKKVINLLEEYGVCIITKFIDNELALEAGNEFKNYFNSSRFKNPRESLNKQYGEESNYLWQSDYAWDDNYLNIAKFNKPIINIRSRQNNVDDAGMIDIFNIQKLAKTEKLSNIDECIKKMSDEKIVSLLTSLTGYKSKQFNLYYNRGVTKTRGPHVDNNSDPYKFFVYLTDVERDADGPYCYFPRSSKKRDWMSFERLKNSIDQNPSTEVSSLSREQLTKFFGKAGTAIITNQSGIHCGGIQSEHGERVLLVSNYY